MRWNRTTILPGAIASACLLGVVATIVYRSKPVEARHPLTEVVEPITFTGCGVFDDGGSRNFQFKDANQREFHVCWVAEEYGGNLILGSRWPLHDHESLSRYPVGGTGDQAFLRLLERWSRQDPDAQLLERRQEQVAKGTLYGDALWKEVDSSGRLPKSMAVMLLRELRRRCPGTK
jgi:hypothetical protein